MSPPPALQEDYHKLLTKYAEAENTIDQLRLGAKVGARGGTQGDRRWWHCPRGHTVVAAVQLRSASPCGVAPAPSSPAALFLPTELRLRKGGGGAGDSAVTAASHPSSLRRGGAETSPKWPGRLLQGTKMARSTRALPR